MLSSSTTGTPRDKTAWPAFKPLPASVEPATTRPARYPVADMFTAGSFANGPRGASLSASIA